MLLYNYSQDIVWKLDCWSVLYLALNNSCEIAHFK